MNSANITLHDFSCERLYSWAAYRQHKGAIKLHILLQNAVCFPENIHMSKGNISDNISELYLRRGKVETFFSDIKRNLKIETFIPSTRVLLWALTGERINWQTERPL